MINIEEYASIIGQDFIDELFLLAKKFDRKTIQNINSTAVGGGVAEILTRMTPMLKQLGINARWDVIKGDDRFFRITKTMHNALHGAKDDRIPFAYANERAARFRRNEAEVTYRTYPEEDHFLFFSSREQALEDIAKWLDQK